MSILCRPQCVKWVRCLPKNENLRRFMNEIQRVPGLILPIGFWLWLCPSYLRYEGQTDELETYRSIYYKRKGMDLSQIHWLFYPTRIRLPLFQVRCRWCLRIMVKMMCLICPRVNMIIRLSCLRRWAQVTDRATSGLMKLLVICCKTYGNFIILPR